MQFWYHLSESMSQKPKTYDNKYMLFNIHCPIGSALSVLKDKNNKVQAKVGNTKSDP